MPNQCLTSPLTIHRPGIPPATIRQQRTFNRNHSLTAQPRKGLSMSIYLAPPHMQPDQTAKPIEVVLLTVKQAAEVLQVSTAVIHRLVNSGELSSVRILNSLRVHSDDLERLVRTGTKKVNMEGKLVESLSHVGLVVAQ
jgi:excisionase family DNA binding protein